MWRGEVSAGKGRRGEGRRGEAGQNGRLSGCPDAPLWAPLGPLDGRLGPPARPSDPSTGRGGKMRETTSPGIATRGFHKQFTDHLKTSLGVVSAGVTKAATVHAKQAIAPSSTEDAVNASTEALQKQTETLQTPPRGAGWGPCPVSTPTDPAPRPSPPPPIPCDAPRPPFRHPRVLGFFSDFSRILKNERVSKILGLQNLGFLESGILEFSDFPTRSPPRPVAPPTPASVARSGCLWAQKLLMSLTTPFFASS